MSSAGGMGLVPLIIMNDFVPQQRRKGRKGNLRSDMGILCQLCVLRERSERAVRQITGYTAKAQR